jgi:hypothetical protein
MRSFAYIFIPVLLSFLIVSGCSRPTPISTVQTYLQMISEERPITDAAVQEITTDRYRSAQNAGPVAVAAEQRGMVLARAEELRKDPAISEFLQRVKWTTTYDTVRQDQSSAEVVARVILTERRKGDRERALAIRGLPQPLVDVLRSGLELPFQFQLRMESGRWKIDDFRYPDSLKPLFEPAAEGTSE